MQRSWPLLVGCVLGCLCVGVLGGLATETGPGSWYSGIAKPVFNPPSWVFAPVWTVLYILIGVALYLAIRSGASRRSLVVFGIQLALNAAWTFLFFAAESPELALGGILLLLGAIGWNIFEFRRVSRLAGWLLVPYLLWVLFATVLTAAIVVLN